MIKRNFPDKILSNQFDSDDTNELLNISIDLIEQIDQDVNLKLTEYNDTFIKTHENLVRIDHKHFLCLTHFSQYLDKF